MELGPKLAANIQNTGENNDCDYLGEARSNSMYLKSFVEMEVINILRSSNKTRVQDNIGNFILKELVKEIA